jgi:hypothetical protein
VPYAVLGYYDAVITKQWVVWSPLPKNDHRPSIFGRNDTHTDLTAGCGTASWIQQSPTSGATNAPPESDENRTTSDQFLATDSIVFRRLGSQTLADFKTALPGLAWVQVEPYAVEVDRRLEVVDGAEATRHALALLNLTVQSLTHRVGARMLVVGQNVPDVPANYLRCLAHRFLPAVRRPAVPSFPELPA